MDSGSKNTSNFQTCLLVCFVDWTNSAFSTSNTAFTVGEQTYQKDQVPANQISAVGAIKVELWRQKFRENMMNVQQGRPFCPLEKISEKSTKGQALSHTVGYVLKY